MHRFVTLKILTLAELFALTLELKLMHEIGVDILVICRIAVQVLMCVYLQDLKA